MKVIGLTGPTGSGKSTVAAEAKKLGMAVIDCDAVAKEVVGGNRCVLSKLASAFGKDIIRDKKLDRKLLAARAFSDEKSTELLNAITLPPICKKIKSLISQYKKDGAKAVLLDAPTLYESGTDSLCDGVIAVLSSRENRKARIIGRDGLSEADADIRLSASKPDGYYTSRTKFVIRNDGDMEKYIADAVKLLGSI